MLENAAQALPAGNAVARAFPLFSRKTSSSSDRTIFVSFAIRDGAEPNAAELARVQRVANATRMAARLVDTPAGELHSDAYLAEIKALVTELGPNVSLKTIVGEELEAQGFGGLWNVGKAAEHPPLLAVLRYTPANAGVVGKTTCFVGKGIIFDTGGLVVMWFAFLCYFQLRSFLFPSYLAWTLNRRTTWPA